MEATQTVNVRYFRSTGGQVSVTIQSADPLPPRALALNVRLARAFPAAFKTWLESYLDHSTRDDNWMSWLYRNVPLEECIEQAEQAFREEDRLEAEREEWRAAQPKKACYNCKREFLSVELMAGSLGSLCFDCYDTVESRM